MSGDSRETRPETAPRRGFRGWLPAVGVSLFEFLIGIALIPVGVALMVASTPNRLWLGSLAYFAWLIAAILIIYHTHRPVRVLARRVWARIAFWGDNVGLVFLGLFALSCPGFLASAPGMAAALVKGGQDNALAAPLLAGFFGTAIGLFLLTPPHRDKAFHKLATIGWLGPVLIAGCFLTCAVTLFTAITLYSNVRFEGVAEVDQLSAGRVASFYLWHFLDLMPFNDIPDTLRWAEPLTYKGTDVGRLVVLFQLCTAAEILATFRAYWTSRNPKSVQPKERPTKTRQKPKRKAKAEAQITPAPKQAAAPVPSGRTSSRARRPGVSFMGPESDPPAATEPEDRKE